MIGTLRRCFWAAASDRTDAGVDARMTAGQETGAAFPLEIE
jgi:hypothetical protein